MKPLTPIMKWAIGASVAVVGSVSAAFSAYELNKYSKTRGEQRSREKVAKAYEEGEKANQKSKEAELKLTEVLAKQEEDKRYIMTHPEEYKTYISVANVKDLENKIWDKDREINELKLENQRLNDKIDEIRESYMEKLEDAYRYGSTNTNTIEKEYREVVKSEDDDDD